jgi:hypothetical protein
MRAVGIAMSDLVCHGSRKLFCPTEVVVTTGTCVYRVTATMRWPLELADSLGLPFLYGALRVCSDEDLHNFDTSCCSCSMVVSCDTTDIQYYNSASNVGLQSVSR